MTGHRAKFSGFRVPHYTSTSADTGNCVIKRIHITTKYRAPNLFTVVFPIVLNRNFNFTMFERSPPMQYVRACFRMFFHISVSLFRSGTSHN